MVKLKGESQTRTWQYFGIFGKDNSRNLIAPQESIVDCLAIAEVFGWVMHDTKSHQVWLLYDYHIWPTDKEGKHIGYE